MLWQVRKLCGSSKKCIHDCINGKMEAKEGSRLWLMEYFRGCARGRDKIACVTKVVVRCGVMVRVVSNVTRVMSDVECDE